jgi:predicted RNase H-like nuclease
VEIHHCLSAINERSELRDKVYHCRAERAKCRVEGDGMLVKKKKERRNWRKTYSIHWVDTIAVTNNNQKSST